MTNVLQHALTLKLWFDETRAQGGKILTQNKDGAVREVISV